MSNALKKPTPADAGPSVIAFPSLDALLRFHRRRWLGITVALLFACTGGAWWLGRSMHSGQETPPTNISRGPWGELETWDIRLEQPAEYRAFDRTASDGPQWTFTGKGEADVAWVLRDCGCTADQAGSLLKSRVDEAGGSIIHPSDDALLSLAPEVRAKLYLVLARDPVNRLQSVPYLIPDGDTGRLFKNITFETKVDVAGLVRRLSYPRNGFVYFSDAEYVLRQIGGSKHDHDEFMKCLLSTNAVMARLLVRPDANIDTPVIYWGLPMPGILVKDIYPLFAAQKQLPQGGAVPISYVLAPMARDALYKTPLPPQPGEKLPDCHWTALNFFNFHPDSRMSDNAFAAKYVEDNFYEIGKPGIACDLVLLANSSNSIVHSAVYLAGDVVYTKNGINLGMPWVLMHEKDMIALFSAIEPVRPVYFRRKDY